MGFCSRNQEKQFIHPTNPNRSPTQHRSKHPTDREHRVRAEGIGLKPDYTCFTLLTFRYSTGLVTLNLSMVEMMIAGVVRKKSRMKRMQLMIKQRIHQEIPPSERCSLQEGTQSQLISKGTFICPEFQVGGACGHTSGHSVGRVRTKHSSYEREEPR